jgi:hypothetical protein
MATVEQKHKMMDKVERTIRAFSGFNEFYADIENGQLELADEEMDVEYDLNQAVEGLRMELEKQDVDSLAQLVVALVANFGDSSTEWGEKRLELMRKFFVED